MSAPASAPLTRRGLRLAQLTVAYNVVEGVLAIGAGLAAGLVSVIGFGIDSGIETAAAVLVALRLATRLRTGRLEAADRDEARERRTLRAVAVTFFLLAAWVTVEGVRALVTGDRPEASPLALGVLIASLVVMPLLARAKSRVGRALGDPLVLADAAETRVCVWLSVATLAGLVAFRLTGAAWFDPLAGFVVAAFAVHEGREAWEGELVHDHDHAEPHEDLAAPDHRTGRH
ncbi:cation diffusion facilitator family transporter [Isoptericola aurantiacus]|uniref:cation diffusion facilitator family transporter n=1 Tax=Isoptericola aurantiacus TaxID=3377839 RepID=UPI00383A51BC